MKRAVILATAILLTATSAMAQSKGVPQVFLEQASDQDEMSTALAAKIKDLLDKARQYRMVDQYEDTVILVVAPSKTSQSTTDQGPRLLVTYEITLANSRNSTSYTASCAPTDLDTCAKSVRAQVDRVAGKR